MFKQNFNPVVFPAMRYPFSCRDRVVNHLTAKRKRRDFRGASVRDGDGKRGVVLHRESAAGETEIETGFGTFAFSFKSFDKSTRRSRRGFVISGRGSHNPVRARFIRAIDHCGISHGGIAYCYRVIAHCVVVIPTDRLPEPVLNFPFSRLAKPKAIRNFPRRHRRPRRGGARPLRVLVLHLRTQPFRDPPPIVNPSRRFRVFMHKPRCREHRHRSPKRRAAQRGVTRWRGLVKN
mmetsp:Transcript_6121/g.23132  ORF Transcript_6121/g.23132 Transcript_6121/m.23132 type:complete len:234 (-) Transcript_6121:1157-1858(-)